MINFFKNLFKQEKTSDESLENLKHISENDEFKVHETQIENLDGRWLSLGKNALNSDIYLRIDNITRIPSSNVNISTFDRMLSNPNTLNDHGDKSTIITRTVDHNKNKFQDIKFHIYKKPMCMGEYEFFELKPVETPWINSVKDTWDWYLNDLVANSDAKIGGIKLDGFTNQ